MPGRKTINIYLIASSASKTKTHIDVCEDMRLRMAEHDHTLKMPGAPKTKKTGQAPWRLYFIILAYQDDKTVNPRALMDEWKTSSRGLESRIYRGIQLAMRHDLFWFLGDAIKDRPIIYAKVKSTVQRGTKRLTADNSDTPGGDDFIIGADDGVERSVSFAPNNTKKGRVQVIQCTP